MFTDIQGYTALMQRNEEKALEAREKHRRIFNSATKKHKGRILQYYGDGTLSIFDSAIDAVKCGIEMQLGFQEGPVIPVRIGIHTGDIIFSEEEIIGDGVNVASRIESLAVPGSVFISDKVYDEVKNVSEQILKNDPLDLESHWQLGLCNYFAARFEEALVHFNNALELDPEYVEAIHWKGIVLGYLGRLEEGMEAMEKAMDIWQSHFQPNVDLLTLKIQMGQKEEVLQTLKTQEFFVPMNPAMLYAIMEMPEEAVFRLEKGYRERALMMISLKHFWVWDSIRDDPGFIEIYDRMNFSD